MRRRILIAMFILLNIVGIWVLLTYGLKQAEPAGFAFSYGTPIHWCFYYEGGKIAWNGIAFFADLIVWVNAFAAVFFILCMVVRFLLKDFEE